MIISSYLYIQWEFFLPSPSLASIQNGMEAIPKFQIECTNISDAEMPFRGDSLIKVCHELCGKFYISSMQMDENTFESVIFL